MATKVSKTANKPTAIEEAERTRFVWRVEFGRLRHSFLVVASEAEDAVAVARKAANEREGVMSRDLDSLQRLGEIEGESR